MQVTEGQKALDSLTLELQVVVNHPSGVPVPDFSPLEGRSTLNCRAISSAL